LISKKKKKKKKKKKEQKKEKRTKERKRKSSQSQMRRANLYVGACIISNDFTRKSGGTFWNIGQTNFYQNPQNISKRKMKEVKKLKGFEEEDFERR